MGCPRCKSAEWKAASLIHMEGTSTTRAGGIGAFISSDEEVGVDASPVIGVGGGTHRTQLSQRAAPPSQWMAVRPAGKLAAVAFLSIGVWMIFLGSAPLQGLVEFSLLALCFVLIGTAVYILVTPRVTREFREKYRQELSRYAQKRMCLRCGTFYGESDSTHQSAAQGSQPTTARDRVASEKKRAVRAVAAVCAVLLVLIAMKDCFGGGDTSDPSPRRTYGSGYEDR